MTKRQWIILQVGLMELNDRTKDGGSDWWDDSADGPPPTKEEIDEVAQIVGDMHHT